MSSSSPRRSTRRRPSSAAWLADHRLERFEDRNIRTYHCGTLPIDNGDRSYRVVVLLLPGMGELAAANATTDALKDWQP